MFRTKDDDTANVNGRETRQRRKEEPNRQHGTSRRLLNLSHLRSAGRYFGMSKSNVI